MNYLRALAVTAMLLALAGCGTDSRITNTYEDCFYGENSDDFSMKDGGIIINTDFGSPSEGRAFDCAMAYLGAGAGLKSRIESTTSLMGRQSETQDGLEWTWSYHPDNGMEMTVEEAD